MPKFIRLKPTSAKEMFVNVEHIIAVQDWNESLVNVTLTTPPVFKVNMSYEDVVKLITE